MWIPTHQHSRYSMLDGLSTAKDIAKKCVSYGYPAAALTDHGTISGVVSFSAACRKEKIKPILGCELYLSKYDATIKEAANRKCSHLCVLAKNLSGWRDLISLVSHTNLPENFYYRPRVQLDTIADFNLNRNLIAFSGHPGSDLWNIMHDEGWNLLPDAEQRACNMAEKYVGIFGRDNFFVEIQTVTLSEPTAISILRRVAKKLGLKALGTADSHYIDRADAVDQRVLLCSSLKTTLNKVYRDIDNDDFGLSTFFQQDCFHIPTPAELVEYYTEEEIKNSLLLSDMCEDYSILSQPKVPQFDPSRNSNELLKELCEIGWNAKLTPEQKIGGEYKSRLDMELGVIFEAGLSDYFLVVQDYIGWALKQGALIGPGRGSSGGSLVAYLLNITRVDPIKAGLYFERFYNAGRNTKDNISLPDIDTDFPSDFREHVVEYIKRKYGRDRVAQIATFGELQGRSSLKEVLRVHEFDYKFSDMICSKIPEYSKISDKLEESGEESILKWTLLNEPEALKDIAEINDKGEIVGPYAGYVAQAIRLEGCYKSRGKHAAGVIIAPSDISKIGPIIYEDDEAIVGFDKNDCEKVGLLKVDILATSVLDKLMLAAQLLKFGHVKPLKNPFED